MSSTITLRRDEVPPARRHTQSTHVVSLQAGSDTRLCCRSGSTGVAMAPVLSVSSVFQREVTLSGPRQARVGAGGSAIPISVRLVL
jgi:hypothetical protein